MDWDFSVISLNVGAFAWAFLLTVVLTIASIVLGTLLGTVFGVGVLSSNGYIRRLARIYVEIFLSLPVLVIIVWAYYVIPIMIPGIVPNGITASVAGLGLSLSAFTAEIVRAGIGTVRAGEVEAAYCLGLNKMQALRHIVLPQATRKMWPPLMGQYITCYKMSTLASVVAVDELLHTGGLIIAQTYRPIEIYTAIAILFVVTVVPINIVTRKLYDSKSYRGIERL